MKKVRGQEIRAPDVAHILLLREPNAATQFPRGPSMLIRGRKVHNAYRGVTQIEEASVTCIKNDTSGSHGAPSTGALSESSGLICDQPPPPTPPAPCQIWAKTRLSLADATAPGLGAALGLWTLPRLGPGCESLGKDHRSKASNLVRVGAARG